MKPRRSKFGVPSDIHRSMNRNWTPRERLKQAQSHSVKTRNVKITLKKAPWKAQEANQ